MSNCALKTWLHCLKIPMAINNPRPWSWSFPRMLQGNSFLSFSLDDKSPSWSVVSGKCSCPPQTAWAIMQGKSVKDGLCHQLPWSLPVPRTGYVLTNPVLSWALTVSLPLGRWWSHGSDWQNLPKSSQLFWVHACTVWPPSSALLGWEIHVGNSDWFWCLKLFISHLQAHTITTVIQSSSNRLQGPMLQT